MAASPSISIAIIGSGGAGALTTGNLLLEAASAAGWHGLFTRTIGPQIRGGEAAALLRFAADAGRMSARPLRSPDRHRLAERAPLRRRDPGRPRTLVIGDPRGGDLPPMVTQSGARVVEVPMKDMAKAIPDGRPNMIALGIAGAAARLYRRADRSAPIEKRLADKGQARHRGEPAPAINVGFDAAAGIDVRHATCRARGAEHSARAGCCPATRRLRFGAIRGGIRFAAAYPITPATEILEWLAPALTKVGGALLQAEDELAAINMIIGASYGGTPSLTATSGPGLVADDRSARPCHRRGNPDRGHRRDARRTVDRHSDQIRAGRPQHRGLRLARRRAASRAGAAIGRRLRVHRRNGRPISPKRCRRRRSFYPTSLSASRAPPSNGPPTSPSSARSGRRHRSSSERLQALRHRGQRRVADGDSGHARRPIHRRRPHPYRARHSDQRRRRPSQASSTSARDKLEHFDYRRPLGDDRRRRRTRGHHLGFAHRRRARSGRARRGRRHQGAADRAAPAVAGRSRNGSRPRSTAPSASWWSSRPTAASSTVTCAPITTCRRRCSVFSRPGPLPITAGEIHRAIAEWR